jgi:futalosine hydrolase
MYLVTAATQFEMEPFLTSFELDGVEDLVTGVGPVETAVRIMAFLHDMSADIEGVVNFGVAGSYVGPKGKPKADILDICLAAKEVFGDLGVCLNDRIEQIRGEGLEVGDAFDMDAGMLALTEQALQDENIPFHVGNFVTVNCASGTAERGSMLARQYKGLCENMEGAAVARVCREFALPCLEVRCISNLVEDRDTSRWQLKQACRRSGEVAAVIVRSLLENSHE